MRGALDKRWSAHVLELKALDIRPEAEPMVEFMPKLELIMAEVASEFLVLSPEQIKDLQSTRQGVL